LEHPSRSSLDVQAEVYSLPQSDYEDDLAMITTDGEKTTKAEKLGKGVMMGLELACPDWLAWQTACLAVGLEGMMDVTYAYRRVEV
jgi:hypothetical protein